MMNATRQNEKDNIMDFRLTDEQKKLFELLDYAYIGARYDINYKITKEQLEQLAPCVKKLHEVTEKICKEKIESFV